MSGDHDKYCMKIEMLGDVGLRLTENETNELINALEEAVYLLDPTEEDMDKEAGVYRIVTALEHLKQKNLSL